MKQPESFTVLEYLQKEKVDLDTLEAIFDGSSYWVRAKEFVTTNKDFPFNMLTVPQASWLYRIRDDLIEFRIKKRK